MRNRDFSGYKAKFITVLAAGTSLYALLYVSHFLDLFGVYITSLAHRSLILASLLTLAFLLLPMRRGSPRDKLPWYDSLFILVAVAGPLYNFFTWSGNAERYMFEEFHTFEIVLALTTVITVLEATRRAVGLGMPLVAVIFLLHMFFGRYLSGPLWVPEVSIGRVVYMMAYLDTGIYGIALGIAATIIIMFIIFSQFMFATGAGDFFIKFAMSLIGHVRGGPAKIAVVASALMGTISGATTANIAATGVFTIPMMKRTGYDPEFAGAVETVASNGGQVMPPIMGLVAFVMAEWLGVSYWSIALAALIPAILYFIAVFIMVDAQAGRLGLRGLPRSECPPVLKTLKEGWLFFLPLAALIFVLGVLLYSPQTAILYALGVLLLLSVVKWAFGAYKKEGTTVRGGAQSAWRVGVNGLRGGTTGMLIPGIACAAAGILLGTLAITQIGIPLSEAAVTLAGNNQLILLMLAAFAAFILGMGMGSLPAYIMVVIIVAPALLDFGVPPLQAHFFVFWFAITCFTTPPVAVGAYVAAAIAEANPMKTALKSVKLGFCVYILPFMFVFNPALLLQGSVLSIAVTAVAALAGVSLFSWGIGGYFLRSTNRLQRLLLLAGGIMFMTLDLKMALVGLALGGIAMGWQVRTARRERAADKLAGV